MISTTQSKIPENLDCEVILVMIMEIRVNSNLIKMKVKNLLVVTLKKKWEIWTDNIVLTIVTVRGFRKASKLYGLERN